MSEWRLGHCRALDGIRGLAIALVLVTHLYVPGGRGFGSMGVTMFFALSGFLITTLLIEEHRAFGTFTIYNFYLRRAARLVPALLVAVVMAALVELLVVGSIADWSLIIGALTWTSNFVLMAGHEPVTPLAHTWSLAIEEQFYLLWPLLLLVLVRLRPRLVLLLLTGLVGASIVIRVQTFDTTVYLGGRSYLGLDARADQLLLGAMLAFASVGRASRAVSGRWAAVPLALILALGLSPYRSLMVPTIVAALTVAAMYVATRARVGWLEGRWLTWLGVHAYGIYLYHRPIGFGVDAAMPVEDWWVAAPFTLALSLAAAWASYRWIEQPVRRYFRSRGNTSRGTSPGPRQGDSTSRPGLDAPA